MSRRPIQLHGAPDPAEHAPVIRSMCERASVRWKTPPAVPASLRRYLVIPSNEECQESTRTDLWVLVGDEEYEDSTPTPMIWFRLVALRPARFSL